MGIGEQFAGLDMKNLIGGPLSAAAESSVILANSTADFINKVGFNADKTARTVLFKFQKSDADPLGNPLRSEMQLEVPMLAIVPIPNLQIDEVNILFDMEVRECTSEEKSLDMNASLSAEINAGIFKARVSGSVASHSSNTRSTDNSAKYHVDVRAANHGTPEGLARVLDIMAACAAPSLLASKMVDGDGKEVDAASKQKRTAINASYQAQQTIGTACKAASDEYDSSIKRLKSLITDRLNSEKVKIQSKLNQIEDPQDAKNDEAKQKANEETKQANEEKRKTYTALLHDLTTSWEQASSSLKTTIESLYDPSAKAGGDAQGGKTDSSALKMAKYFSLKEVSGEGTEPMAVTTIKDGPAAMDACFNTAYKNYATYKRQDAALIEERGKYNALLMQR